MLKEFGIHTSNSTVLIPVEVEKDEVIVNLTDTFVLGINYHAEDADILTSNKKINDWLCQNHDNFREDCIFDFDFSESARMDIENYG